MELLQTTCVHIPKIISDNGYEMDGFPRCTAAGYSYLDKSCDMQSRWIAVGDAATAFDPLSSQGMMTALELGAYIGGVVAKLTMEPHTDIYTIDIEGLYTSVRQEFEQRRGYYYNLVKRFENEQFWATVNA
jgi:flavin-dependent dehydrogenase